MSLKPSGTYIGPCLRTCTHAYCLADGTAIPRWLYPKHNFRTSWGKPAGTSGYCFKPFMTPPGKTKAVSAEEPTEFETIKELSFKKCASSTPLEAQDNTAGKHKYQLCRRRGTPTSGILWRRFRKTSGKLFCSYVTFLWVHKSKGYKKSMFN